MMTRFYTVLAICLLPLVSSAQEDDFGIWYSVSTKLGITERIDAGISVEMRTFNNAGKVEQGYFEAGGEYRISEYLSAGIAYRLTDALENDSRYHLQHKLFADLKSSIKPGRFALQARVRFQTRFRSYFEEVWDKIPDYTLRIRLKAIYRTPSFPLNPYLSAETFIPLNKDPEKFIGKNRFSAGVEYDFSKKHSIEAGYVLQRDYLPSIFDENIISVGYNLNF